jgi:hypothetical protein
MKVSMRWMALGLCLLLPMLFSCGGGVTTPLVQRTTVQVMPSEITVGASGTVQFSARVNNADYPYPAVTWTLSGCSGEACGAISPVGLYTAPSLIVSPATVTVIATLKEDSKATGQATVTHAPLSLEVSPAQTMTLGAGATQVFTASVTKHPNPDVTWSLSGTGCTGDGCGTLTNATASSVTYDAPATLPNQALVVVKATAVADDTKSQSVSINLMPISVSVIPGPEAMAAPSGTRSFRAIVQYDAQNAGATWKLSGAGCSGNDCGSLTDVTSSSVVYHAPATPPDPPTVTLTATSVTNTVYTATSTITVSSALSVLEGKYAFLIRGYSRETGTGMIETMAGHFDADGNGNLVGLWDANRGLAVEQAQAITGSYAVQPDGRGSMYIETGTTLLTFTLTMDATGAAARLAEGTLQGTEPGQVPGLRGSSGIMARQDPVSFSFSSVNGDRVIALSGNHTGSPAAVLGRFTASPGGVLGAGVVDLSWEENYLGFAKPFPLSGSFGAPNSSSGRGTASLATGQGAFNFAYYIVSNSRILLVQTDARGPNMPTLSGEVRLQTGAGHFANASLSAPLVFNLSGTMGWWDGYSDIDAWIFGTPYPGIAIGEILPNGAGWLAVTYDQNEAGIATANGTGSGDYAVEVNGRVSLALTGHAVAYLTDQNSGYLIRGNMQGSDFGRFEPQAGGPFNLQALSGTFRFNTDLPSSAESLNSSGLLTLGEDGKAVATLSGSISDFSGTLNVDLSGRGVLTLATSSETTPAHMVVWAISPEHCVALMNADPGYVRPVLVHLERLR